MIAIPAVDVRDGACVQLAGGPHDRQRVRLPDPVGVVRGWSHYGFQRIHLVDLDAATGRRANSEIIHEILAEPALEVQVAGGVRSGDVIERLLEAGAERVVLGARALEHPDWLAEMAHLFAGELVVAIDVHDRQIVTRAPRHRLTRNVLDVVEELNSLPLGGLFVTAVHREGSLQGADLFLMEDVVELSDVPVYASGGIATMQDLRALDNRGVAGAVIGTALYSGALDPRAVAEEFTQ